MAKLNIERFEEKVLFPDLPVKHYRVYCSLITSDGQSHPTYCDLSRDHGSSTFDFTCFDNADIDEFDFRNKWAMSEKVLKWANVNIPQIQSDKKTE